MNISECFSKKPAESGAVVGATLALLLACVVPAIILLACGAILIGTSCYLRYKSKKQSEDKDEVVDAEAEIVQ